MKIKNLAVVALVGVCFWFAYDRLAKFYYNHFPVAAVGECIEFSVDGKTSIKALVMGNDSQTDSSFLIVVDKDTVYPMELTYAELRNDHAKKAVCFEKTN